MLIIMTPARSANDQFKRGVAAPTVITLTCCSGPKKANISCRVVGCTEGWSPPTYLRENELASRGLLAIQPGDRFTALPRKRHSTAKMHDHEWATTGWLTHNVLETSCCGSSSEGHPSIITRHKLLPTTLRVHQARLHVRGLDMGAVRTSFFPVAWPDRKVFARSPLYFA